MQGGYLKTKKVYVFVNGRDDYKSFNIHPKCRMGWNAILALFTTSLKPTFGAIRVLRTRDGKSITESFEDLKHEGKYVACGLEPFKKGGYRTNSELELKMKPTEYYPTEILSADDQKKYPCLIETMRKGRTIIFVFANGKKTPPRKVVFIKSDYKIWDNMLIHIGNILDIPEGVKGLCTVFGQPLCSPYEIQHGGYYVAIPCNATFKKVKYLAAVKKSDSYHESSPLITKGAYVSASKTCTSMEGLLGKRRRGKSTSARESLEERKIRRSSKEHKESGEDCICVDEEVEKPSVKKTSAKEVQQQPQRPSQDKETVQDIDQQEIEANIVAGTDGDTTEGQIKSEVYDQNEIFTQTSALCFESTCDQENAIIMNEKKFFLLTEEQIQHLKDSNPESPPIGTSVESTHWTDHHFTDQDMEEIREVAGNFIGIITKVSEKMIAKTLFGTDNSSIDIVHDDQSSEDITGKVMFYPDSLQPKPPSVDIVEEKLNKARKERHQSLKSLRLSLPIGRGMDIDDDPNEDVILPQKRVSLHSPPVEMTDSLLEEIHEQYAPLTPSHTKNRKESSEEVEDNGNHEENTGTYIPFFGLRRDSIGIPLISKLYGARKESIDEDEDEDDEADTDIQQDDEMQEEIEREAREEDEWQKLDILEDMELDEDHVELGESEEKNAIVAEKDETDTLQHQEEQQSLVDAPAVETMQPKKKQLGLVDAPAQETMQPKKKQSGLVDAPAVEKMQPKEKQPGLFDAPVIETLQPEDEQPPINSDSEIIMEPLQRVSIKSEHSQNVSPVDEENKMDDEIGSEHSKNSDAEVVDTENDEEITSDHSRSIESEDRQENKEGSSDQVEIFRDLEETKDNVQKTSDHSHNSSEGIEEPKESEENISDHLQSSNTEIEDIEANRDIKSDHSQISNLEGSEDVVSILSDHSDAVIEEVLISEEVTEDQPQNTLSDKSAENTDSDEQSLSKPADIGKPVEEKIEKKKEKVISREPKEGNKETKKRHSSGGQYDMKLDIEQSLTSTKGSSSHYYGERDLQTPEKIYGSLLETSGDIARNSDGSRRRSTSSELPVLTQKSKVGSYCVTLNSWISMKVEECNETTDRNHDTFEQSKSPKHKNNDKHEDKRNVKTEFEEERRRSLLNFMRMRIELALSNKIPELRQPKESSD